MTSSLKRPALSRPEHGKRIPLHSIAFARARAKNKAHSYLLDLFEDSGLTKSELAKRLGKRPEQVTRWLSGPGNLTLDTLSDLTFAINGDFLAVSSVDEFSKGKSNHQVHERFRSFSTGTWSASVRSTSSEDSAPAYASSVDGSRGSAKFDAISALGVENVEIQAIS